MPDQIVPPFSARNSGARTKLDNDCPESARIGLLYLLDQLVQREYMSGWNIFCRELQRLGRFYTDFDGFQDARAETRAYLIALDWEKVYDFCERLHSYLARDVWVTDSFTHQSELRTRQIEIQQFITAEIQRIFLEENLAFEFSNGIVRRKGRRTLNDQVSRAEVVMSDPRLSKSLAHFNKALRYFRNVTQPDPQNTVKEAVCAVEAAGRALFPTAGNTLGDIAKSIAGSGVGQLPRPIAKTIDGLYGFRNSGEGVGHGGTDGGPVTMALAEYALAISASQIVLLVDVAASLEEEPPF